MTVHVGRFLTALVGIVSFATLLFLAGVPYLSVLLVTFVLGFMLGPWTAPDGG
jgi:hypothetical protein